MDEPKTNEAQGAPPETIEFRLARTGDVPEISRLIDHAFRTIGTRAYSDQQVETALADGVVGLDARLIEDGTYFVAETPDGQVVGCGGWSWRRKAFGAGQGGRAFAAHEDEPMDPQRGEPAWIRAFFVHPDWTRRGIARRLLALSEEAARAAGYGRTELLATETGIPLYLACGYVVLEYGATPMPSGGEFTGARMTKELR
jgi:predicted N-acetyltransferase YhbS